MSKWFSFFISLCHEVVDVLLLLSLRNQSCCILNFEQWDLLALCHRTNSSSCVQCGLMECLNNMLLKWLTWHSVYALEDDLDISLNSHTSMWASQPHARRTLVKMHSKWHIATFAKWWFSVSRRLLWVTNHSVCPPAQLFKTFGGSRDYQPANTWIRISWTALANYGRLFIRKVPTLQICTICSPPTTKTVKVEWSSKFISSPCVFNSFISQTLVLLFDWREKVSKQRTGVDFFWLYQYWVCTSQKLQLKVQYQQITFPLFFLVVPEGICVHRPPDLTRLFVWYAGLATCFHSALFLDIVVPIEVSV